MRIPPILWASLLSLGGLIVPQAAGRHVDLAGAPARTGTAAEVSDDAGSRLGGCRTTWRAYGLPAQSDSLALKALGEILRGGSGGGGACAERGGPACRRLGVDTPLFIQVGALDLPADSVWVSAVRTVGVLLERTGVRLAERTLLGLTSGPCFPPHHVDLRACGDSLAVAAFLDALPREPWPGCRPAKPGARRDLLLSAGTSLSSPSVAFALICP